jgi:threonine dehydratase
VKLDKQPATLADGAMTLAVSERTLSYVKKTNGVFEITENEMRYWTQWLTHMLKVTVEPTSALAMAAAARYLSGFPAALHADNSSSLPNSPSLGSPQSLVVLLSGGNISQHTHAQVWDRDYLHSLPSLGLPWHAL